MMEGKNSHFKSADSLFDLPAIVVASHELKSPLALIRQLSLMIDDGLSQEELSQFAMRIQLTSERSLRMVQNLSMIGNPDNLELSFQLEPVNINASLKQLEADVQPLFLENNCQLSVRYLKNPPLCIANSELISRVLMNFTDNALKYALGGGQVSVSASSNRQQSTLRLAVRDYGPGLPSATKRELEQGNQPIRLTTARRPDSSGLGLFVAKQFAEIMNGRLGVIRHRNGTSFFMDLPLSRQASLL